MEWIEYGKSYGQLVHDLKQVGESIVGIQIDLPKEPARFIYIEGRQLIGHVNAEGDISGEEYVMIEDLIITRYRRLVTTEELNG